VNELFGLALCPQVRLGTVCNGLNVTVHCSRVCKIIFLPVVLYRCRTHFEEKKKSENNLN
jgi:hypothetical protein